jgi:antimicrobial peptide system SdpB family protein
VLSHDTEAATRIRAWAGAAPWTSTVGLARALLALGTLVTLLGTPPSVLLSPLADGTRPPVCTGVLRGGLWCLAPQRPLVATVVSVAVLVVVIAGWRPRVTALLHWWVAWSFTAGVTLQDGGDQVNAVLCLLLLPVALTDPRRWHWSPGPARPPGAVPGWPWLIARIGRLLIMVQVAAIYLHACIAKLGVTEWADGTALWYWLRHPQFGAASWLSPVTDRLTAQPWGVVGLTWGTMIIEFLLGVAILMRPLPRRVLLVVGLGLHAGIMVVMGLVSFFCAMAAALVLLLVPVGQELPQTWPVRLWKDIRGRFIRHSSAAGAAAP